MKLLTNRVTSALAAALMLGQLTVPALAVEVRSDSDSVNIDEAFSDPLFQAWLKDRSNLNGAGADGVLTQEERAAVLAIDVSAKNISDLSGVELFPNLRSLNFSNNQVTQLNLTENTALTWLYGANNQLTSLDLSHNTKLQGVDLSGNRLSALDVSQLTQLGYLYVDYNFLTQLDLSANTSLKGLGFTAIHNQLESITLPNAPSLTVELSNFAAQNPSQGCERVRWLQDGSPVADTVQANGQTLRSEGIPNTFTLFFSANGGKGSVGSISGSYGQEVTVPQNGFTRYGYTFSGWNTQANGRGTSYQPDAKIADLGQKYDGQRVTLYAQWTPITYSITFDANGGSGSASEDSVSFDQKVTLPNEGFTNDTAENLTLAGWASSQGGPVLYAPGSQVQGLSGNADDTVTLYAVWTLTAEGEQATRLEALAQAFAAYSSSDYTTQDWTALNSIYNQAVTQIGTTQETEDMDAIVTTCEEDMANVPTRAQREEEVSGGFQYAHQDVLDQLSGSAVTAGNASDLLAKAKAALADLTGEGLKQFSHLETPEDLESVTASVLSALSGEAAQLESLRAAAQWVADLDGLSQKAMADVRSTDAETYRSARENYAALPEDQSPHIGAGLSSDLDARYQLASAKRSAVAELDTAYAGFDLSLYSEKGKAALEKAHTDGVAAVESASSDQAVTTAKEEASAAMKAVPTADEEASNPIPEQPGSGGSNSGGSGSGGSSSGGSSGNETKPQDKPQQEAGQVTTVTDEKTGTVTQVSTASDGKVTASVTVPQGVRSVTVSIPCAATDSTVAVLVHADGTREVLSKVARTADGLALRLDGSATVEIVDNAKAFDDVDDDAWFAAPVQFAASRNLFQGVGGGDFAPAGSMTRSMLVTVLYRLEGTPDITGSTAFDDVAGSDWYTDAVDWAVSSGITTGTGSGSFQPNDSITRESLAVMLYRYAQSLGLNTKTSGDLGDRFQDAGHVSDWAREAVNWASASGILQGSENQLRPEADTSRAEVATMLMRFVSLLTQQDADLAQ